MGSFVPPRQFHREKAASEKNASTNNSLFTPGLISTNFPTPHAQDHGRKSSGEKTKNLFAKLRGRSTSTSVAESEAEVLLPVGSEVAVELEPRPEKQEGEGDGHEAQEDEDVVAESESEVEKHIKFINWLHEHETEEQLNQIPQSPGKDEKAYFRCDIFATNGEDFTEAERECKQLIVGAGGEVVTEFEYLGGFLYTLPTNPSTTNFHPLESSDETLPDGYIRITPCTTCKKPGNMSPEPLSMTPPSKVSHLQVPSPRTPASPASPLSAKSSRTSSSSNKDWPRPRDFEVMRRAGDWVKGQAARRLHRLDEEARNGIGKEVVEGEVQLKAKGCQGDDEEIGSYELSVD